MYLQLKLALQEEKRHKTKSLALKICVIAEESEVEARSREIWSQAKGYGAEGHLAELSKAGRGMAEGRVQERGLTWEQLCWVRTGVRQTKRGDIRELSGDSEGVVTQQILWQVWSPSVGVRESFWIWGWGHRGSSSCVRAAGLSKLF